MDAQWPRSNDHEPVPVRLKSQPEDFQVRELLPFEPAGDGEHLLLEIEKRCLGTPELARMLADAHGIDHVDVGYAGMKDKHALTRQWFSLRGVTELDETVAAIDGIRVLGCTKHQQKLRRGQLGGNEFRILLRPPQLDSGGQGVLDAAATEAAVNSLGAQGAPNYFGGQRFGWDNLRKAATWLGDRRRRRLSKFKQGLYLSVLRSFLFNEVLAARVTAGNWRVLLDGDVPDTDGRPTGPLWGRGRSATAGSAAELEQAALTPHAKVQDGLEYAGLDQARRSLAMLPIGFERADCDEGLLLSFTLGPGQYATSLLADRFDLQEAVHEPAR